MDDLPRIDLCLAGRMPGLRVRNKVARPRKEKKPRQSVVVVKNGLAPVAGSKPRRSPLTSGISGAGETGPDHVENHGAGQHEAELDMAEPERAKVPRMAAKTQAFIRPTQQFLADDAP